VAEQTSGSIDIAAPPDAVLAVISDVERYPAWVDSMTSAQVLTTADGRPETVRMVLDHPVVKDDYVLRYAWEPAVVSWRLVQGRLLKTMDGSYTVEPSATGSRVTYRLTVDANLPMIGMFRRKAEKTIIDGALRGLQRRVEG
jgi:carbon monoxide dehydrogenase subunit G